MNEIESFWDDFAADYVAAQATKQTTIEEDFCHYLVRQGVLPTDKLVDLAGGAGRFLPTLRAFCNDYLLVDISQEMLRYAAKKVPATDKKVQFIHQSQELFLTPQEKEKAADVLFSAMNPAIEPTNETELLALEQQSNQVVVLLRVIAESDSLLAPLDALDEEQVPQEWQWMESYQELLLAAGRQVHTHDFTYNWTETVPLAVVEEVYEAPHYQVKLKELLAQHIQDPENLTMQCQMTWRCLWWRVPQEKG